MIETEFKPLEPHYVNGAKIKVLATNEKGVGFCSPCPQLYITIQNKEVAIIGYDNIVIIKKMLKHALSNGRGII